MKYRTFKKTSRIFFLVTTLILSSTMVAYAGNQSGMTDGAIIAIYNQVNTFDIETAGLAIANAKDKRVIGLAKMVQTDHTAVRQMAADLAIKLGQDRSLPPSRANAASQHANVLSALSSKKGAEFDKAYLEHEIQFHTAAISAVKSVLIPKARNNELRDLMKKILPGFEHHLAETRRVSKELGYQ